MKFDRIEVESVKIDGVTLRGSGPDHDHGDESDAPETVEDWVAWLSRQMTAALNRARSKPFDRTEDDRRWTAILGKPWRSRRLVRATINPGAHHDPGDEDRGVLVYLEDGVSLSFVIA